MAGLRVALAAEDAAGKQALGLMRSRGDLVVAVFSGAEHGPVEAFEPSLRNEAKVAGALVRDAVDVRDAASGDWLRGLGIDVLLSVHCRQKIDEALLEAPTLGSFNIHPGPLPEVSGLHPTSWALYEGVEEHGVTVHEMTPELDAGNIVAEERFPVRPSESAIGLLTQCVRRERAMLSALLDDLEIHGKVPSKPQNSQLRRWFGAAPQELAHIDWSWSSRKICNLVRACDYRPFPSPWGSVGAIVRGQRVEICEAEPAGLAEMAEPEGMLGSVRLARDGSALLATGDGWLKVWEVGVEDAELPASAVLQDGDRLEVFMSRRLSTPGE
jgi:methionyl-tRNA formyltransferase